MELGADKAPETRASPAKRVLKPTMMIDTDDRIIERMQIKTRETKKRD
jgi:hypothetical protein